MNRSDVNKPLLVESAGDRSGAGWDQSPTLFFPPIESDDPCHNGTNIPTEVGYYWKPEAAFGPRWFLPSKNRGSVRWRQVFEALLRRFESLSNHLDERCGAILFQGQPGLPHDHFSRNEWLLNHEKGDVGFHGPLLQTAIGMSRPSAKIWIDCGAALPWAFNLLDQDGEVVDALDEEGQPLPGRLGFHRDYIVRNSSEPLMRLVKECANSLHLLPSSVASGLLGFWPQGYRILRESGFPWRWIDFVFEQSWLDPETTYPSIRRARAFNHAKQELWLSCDSRELIPSSASLRSPSTDVSVDEIHGYCMYVNSEVDDLVSASIAAITGILDLKSADNNHPVEPTCSSGLSLESPKVMKANAVVTVAGWNGEDIEVDLDPLKFKGEWGVDYPPFFTGGDPSSLLTYLQELMRLFELRAKYTEAPTWGGPKEDVGAPIVRLWSEADAKFAYQIVDAFEKAIPLIRAIVSKFNLPTSVDSLRAFCDSLIDARDATDKAYRQGEWHDMAYSLTDSWFNLSQEIDTLQAFLSIAGENEPVAATGIVDDEEDTAAECCVTSFEKLYTAVAESLPCAVRHYSKLLQEIDQTFEISTLPPDTEDLSHFGFLDWLELRTDADSAKLKANVDAFHLVLSALDKNSDSRLTKFDRSALAQFRDLVGRADTPRQKNKLLQLQRQLSANLDLLITDLACAALPDDKQEGHQSNPGQMEGARKDWLERLKMIRGKIVRKGHLPPDSIIDKNDRGQRIGLKTLQVLGLYNGYKRDRVELLPEAEKVIQDHNLTADEITSS